MSSLWRQAERRRLLTVSERLARRRAWHVAQRDAASVRAHGLDAELATVDAELAELDRRERAETGQ